MVLPCESVIVCAILKNNFPTAWRSDATDRITSRRCAKIRAVCIKPFLKIARKSG
jgi:hypothetical protein